MTFSSSYRRVAVGLSLAASVFQACDEERCHCPGDGNLMLYPPIPAELRWVVTSRENLVLDLECDHAAGGDGMSCRPDGLNVPQMLPLHVRVTTPDGFLIAETHLERDDFGRCWCLGTVEVPYLVNPADRSTSP